MRFDLREEDSTLGAIQFINDIESDPMYSRFPTSLMNVRYILSCAPMPKQFNIFPHTVNATKLPWSVQVCT